MGGASAFEPSSEHPPESGFMAQDSCQVQDGTLGHLFP